MAKYTVKRLLQGLVTVLLIATLVFLLMRLLPTDYYFTEEQQLQFTDEQKEAALKAAGYLDPIGTQLVNFYKQLLHFDFGESRRLQSGVRVVDVIGGKFQISIRLGSTALAISLFFGIILGILQTLFKDKLADHLGAAYTIFVNSVPGLVSYSLLLIFGCLVLGLPTMYSASNPGPSMILPVVCLSIGSIAGYTKALLSAVPIPDPELEKKKKLLVYDPSVHDYSVDGPVWYEIKPGHFVYGNKKELKEYEAVIRD